MPDERWYGFTAGIAPRFQLLSFGRANPEAAMQPRPWDMIPANGMEIHRRGKAAEHCAVRLSGSEMVSPPPGAWNFQKCSFAPLSYGFYQLSA